jgi:hypothetical protein
VRRGDYTRTVQRLLPVAIAVAILGGLLGGVLASRGSAGSTTATCRYGGVRYVGTTSQHGSICFTLTPKGKIMREYTYEYMDTCGTGTMRALNPRAAGVVPVLPTGAFSQISPDGFFKGTIKAGKATGTFRRHSAETIPGKGLFTCDTHLVHWTAKRKS